MLLERSPQQARLKRNLTITDNVRLEETQTLDPSEKPLIITGDKVVAVNFGRAGTPHRSAVGREVTVLGRPAHVEGHGLSLNGSNINLDRGANHLWIEGPGSMELPMPDNVNGQPIAAPGTHAREMEAGHEFRRPDGDFRGRGRRQIRRGGICKPKR